MSTQHRSIRTLIPWLGVILGLCVIITVLAIQTRGEVGTVSATEEFDNSFGGPTEDINLLGMIQKNQFALITVLMLIVMAAYSLEFMVERWLTLAIARRQSLNFLLRVGEELFHSRLEEATALSADYPRSPVAFAVLAFVRSNENTLRRDADSIERSMPEWQRAIVIKSAEIKRRLWTLGAIGWSAPLLGLLYASARVTQTLQWWNITEGNSFAPYANEVAQAAWGVSFSIVIAIPVIWAHKYLTAHAEEMIFEMEHLSLAIIEQLGDRRVSSLPNLSSTGYITQRLSATATRRLAR